MSSGNHSSIPAFFGFLLLFSGLLLAKAPPLHRTVREVAFGDPATGEFGDPREKRPDDPSGPEFPRDGATYAQPIGADDWILMGDDRRLYFASDRERRFPRPGYDCVYTRREGGGLAAVCREGQPRTYRAFELGEQGELAEQGEQGWSPLPDPGADAALLWGNSVATPTGHILSARATQLAVWEPGSSARAVTPPFEHGNSRLLLMPDGQVRIEGLAERVDPRMAGLKALGALLLLLGIYLIYRASQRGGSMIGAAFVAAVVILFAAAVYIVYDVASHIH